MLLLFLVLLAAAAPASGEAPPVYRVIRPTDEAHDLLPKTCQVCHKGQELHFFLVAGPSADSLEKAVQLLSGRVAVAAAPAAPGNPHAGVACLFCHVEPPDEGRAVGDLTFRTVEGKAVAREAQAKHCEMCHPGDPRHHPRVTRGKAAAADLARAGLPLAGDTVLCTTCHDVHDEQATLASLRRAYASFAARSPESYPHRNRSGCVACHPVAPTDAGAVAFREGDPTARCARCHPADHGGIHPMAVVPTPDTFPLDFLDYPLDAQGRLSCSTCHDHPCTQARGEPNRGFLRGGPYSVSTDFCYRCHPRAGAGSLNPHRQVGARGEILTTTCAFCHRRIPAPDDPEAAYEGPEDLLFLYSPVELCAGCHEPSPHPSGINHLVDLPEARRVRLAAYEERHAVSLPLYEGTAVVCTTCHNPHDKGVLKGRAALGAAEVLLWRVPSYAELCTPCHARYD